MTELDKTDQRNDKRHVMNGFRARRALIVRLGLLAFLMIIALGNRECDPSGSQTLDCTGFNLLVEPGTCEVFQNPCEDNQWTQPSFPDGFRLEPTEEQFGLIAAAQVSVRTTRSGDETTRSVCVAPHAPLFAGESIPYLYARGSEYATGNLNLTVAPRLNLTATATPSTIAIGESSQLFASVSGGIPPYFYSWVPSSSLNQDNVQAPIATPSLTTLYTVAVEDSGGQLRFADVTVVIGFDVVVNANPAVINPGGSSRLGAVASGGTPPYTYSWTPTVGLDDPFSQDPLATPATTTTYQVTARDSASAVRNRSVTVTVLSTPLTASFVFNVTFVPPTLHLDASASTGNIVSYTWDLSWTAANPDRVTSSPLTSFPVSEVDHGLITLTVTDAAGNTATMTRNF